jgi:hypothetical protein
MTATLTTVPPVAAARLLAPYILAARAAQREADAALAEHLNATWWDDKWADPDTGYLGKDRDFSWRLRHPHDFGDA